MEVTFKDLKLHCEQANKKGQRARQNKSGGYIDGNKNQGTRNIPKWKLENLEKEKKLKKQDKTYYWCKYHNNDKGMWVLHKPKQCRNKPISGGSDKSNTEQEKTHNKTRREQAMPEIFEDNHNNNSDSNKYAAL